MSAEEHPRFLGRRRNGEAVFTFSDPRIVEAWEDEQRSSSGDWYPEPGADGVVDAPRNVYPMLVRDDPGPTEPPDDGFSWDEPLDPDDIKDPTTPENDGHSINLVCATDVFDDIPTWVWHYDEKGRIQLATLALFAGRPGAGKSTAARWFTAQYTRGTLGGIWEGKPQHVCYIATEESREYIIKPGLRAAGTDLARVHFPSVTFAAGSDGAPTILDDVPILATRDEKKLTALLVARGIKVVIVDPVMSTISSATDVHRNNEVRAALEPWSRIAEKIDGVVHGVVHLNKAPGGDIVAAINGSSAFGEVARSVFAFAKDPDSDDGHRVMSQEKNNAGEEDLALVYAIEKQFVRTDSGRTAEVGRFVIIGDSDRTVGDVLRDTRSGPGRPPSRRTQAVLACAESLSPPITAAAIAEKLNLDAGNVGTYLRRLVGRGQLRRIGHGEFARARGDE